MFFLFCFCFGFLFRRPTYWVNAHAQCAVNSSLLITNLQMDKSTESWANLIGFDILMLITWSFFINLNLIRKKTLASWRRANKVKLARKKKD